MKIVIPGGSGQVGTILAREFHQAGHEVVVLSRRRDPRPWRVASWDGATPGDWIQEVDGSDVVIMSPDAGGIFDTLLGLVRRGLGGTAGDGRQFVSWIHHEDFVKTIRWLIEHDAVDGFVNVAAPHPLPNREFIQVLRQAWGIPVGLPAARWMLEVGAAFMRTETELLLKSRRVVPGTLLERGFDFTFSGWPNAARDLCREWRC